MKRLITVVLCVLLLTGCSGSNHIDKAMSLRENILNSDGCGFYACITADYGEKIYTFGMQCTFDQSGRMTFTVEEPSSIAGISGQISEEKGCLTFDAQVLAFELLADGQVTPVSAPWLIMKALRSGYIHSCAQQGDDYRITVDDSYEEKALQVDVWVKGDGAPYYAEVLWQNRRVLSVSIEAFSF